VAKRLGKGLGALIQDIDRNDVESVQEADLTKIFPNPHQPRKIFDEEKLEELAASIRQHGIIQPITVQRSGDGFEIVAGERRWRAAKLAGLLTAPIHIRVVEDDEMLELALIENLQRDDLSPMEEAYAYKALIEDLSYTQEVLGKRLGKSRPHIANTLRLLALPQFVQDALDKKIISAGHARALLMASDKETLQEVFKLVVDKGLSVRETEKLCCSSQEKDDKPSVRAKKVNSVFEKDVIGRLQEFLGTGIRINRTEKKGVVEVDFYSEEDLTRLCDLILEDR
jgi:ParB family chromosome partitioning protein